MKIFMFYKNTNNNEEILYAITNNKKYAKKFVSSRNMKKFRLETMDMTKSQYADFCNLNENRSSVLEQHDLITVKDGMHTASNYCSKKVIMTYWEHQIIDDNWSMLDDLSAWGGSPCPTIFKNKYIESLKKIEYITHFKLYVLPYMNEFVQETVGCILDLDDDYDVPGIENDELAIFITTFRESF